MLVALLPTVIMAAGLVVMLVHEGRADRDRELTDRTRSLSLDVDRELTASIRALETLATAPSLERGELRKFHAEAERVLQIQPYWNTILLYDLTGQQLVNLRRPYGSPLPMASNPMVKQVVDTGQPAVSDLFMGKVAGVPVLNVNVPVVRQGQITYVLGAAIDPTTLGELLSDDQLPPNWTAVVLDRQKVLIARSRGVETHFGERGAPGLAAESTRRAEGTLTDVTRDGESVYGAFRRSPVSGWTVAVGVPTAVLDGPLYRFLGLVTAGGVGLLGLGLLLARRLAGRIAGPIGALAVSAEAIARGDLAVTTPSDVAELNCVQRTLEETGALLRHRTVDHDRAERLLHEREAALKELHGVTAGPGLDLTQRMRELLRLGCRRFGLEIGVVCRIVDGERCEVVESVSPDTMVPRGRLHALGETFCAQAVEGGVVSVAHAEASGEWRTRGWYTATTHEAYLGAPLIVDGTVYGALSFSSPTSRPTAFQSAEKELLKLMAQWLGGEIGRQQAQERLRLQAAALEAAANAIVLTDRQGRILWVNRAFSELTGYSPEEALGQSPRLLKSGVQNGEVYDTLWATILSGHVWQGELVNRRRDGTLYTESETITPLRDARGSISHFIAIKQDVTARKRAEAELRAASDELTSTQTQLVQAQKMEALGQLAAGVAHDFNNLLTVIIGRATLLGDGLAPDDRLGRHVVPIEKAAERAATLTRQLLAFSRKQILEPKILDLNAVVAEAAKLLRRLIGEDVELVVAPELDLQGIKADPTQLEQVVMNLAVNARDAMPRGGRLILETANVDLDEAFVRSHPGVTPGRYVRLAVSDTGIGMNAETQAHLFEPFFTTKEPGKGTGLGLATVYGIVKQSQGYIAVESAPGQGARFEIYLPRVDAAAARLEPAPLTGEAPRGSEVLLLVEDEASLRELTRETLQGHGYRVLEAGHGAEALEVSDRHPGPIDLLVTDIVMPHMSGRELAERLVLQRPGLKALYISGYTDDTILRHGVTEGTVTLLRKPFTPDTLVRKVREVLDAVREAVPAS